ncbi:MAG: APC family permease [Saprospiraceae bacterium]
MKGVTSQGLSRQLGLAGLAATGICSMIGASIYVVPFMIQRNVPGIGPFVLPAFLLAALPAALAAFSYAILASAMPRAGGSYIFASRALSPYLGFVASFSQWFGLSIAIGVVSYVIVPFLRDMAEVLQWDRLADWLEVGWVRVLLSMIILWTFVWVNVRGIKWYKRTLIPLMLMMFGLGALVIATGLFYTQADFTNAILSQQGEIIHAGPAAFNWTTLLSGAALLFASFIGFDSIAQAGGEAKDPSRLLPRAIGVTMITVTAFYFLFTYALYHAVPWNYVAREALVKDVTAPGLLSIVMPSELSVFILAGATIALFNDLPAMILSVSRLMFAWAEDGIFPKRIASIHPIHHTPGEAIRASGLMASVGILGSHFAGDFFLGVDIMVTSMLVNYLLMCLCVLYLPKRNPAIAQHIAVFKSRRLQKLVAGTGTLLLFVFLLIHLVKDFSSEVGAWYFHSTFVWLTVMAIATCIFWWKWKVLKNQGINTRELYRNLPAES